MLISKDTSAKIDYTLQENSTKSVIIFNYSKTVKGNVQDAGYREEVAFEIDHSAIHFANATPQSTKMIFGRFCYCKGQTGYYKVDNGKFLVDKDSNIVTLDFTIQEVPQIVKQVRFLLK